MAGPWLELRSCIIPYKLNSSKFWASNLKLKCYYRCLCPNINLSLGCVTFFSFHVLLDNFLYYYISPCLLTLCKEVKNVIFTINATQWRWHIIHKNLRSLKHLDGFGYAKVCLNFSLEVDTSENLHLGLLCRMERVLKWYGTWERGQNSQQFIWCTMASQCKKWCDNLLTDRVLRN